MTATVLQKKIQIVSQSHLCRNPRVLKEAKALAKAGFEVSILTAVYDHELYQQDLALLAGSPITYRLYSDLRNANWRSFKARLIRKLWLFAQSRLHIENKRSLGYNPGKLKKEISRTKADLYIMHQELATVEGSKMAGLKRVAFDFEDWYSEDLLPEARSARPIALLKFAEKKAIERGAFCYTTSKAMAHELKAHYKTKLEPLVIYNSFDLAPKAFTQVNDGPYIRLYWFSQTIGEGRGLEFFIDAITQNKFRWQLNLRGQVSIAYKARLNSMLSSKDSIRFLPIISNNELTPDMQNYDYGLALEPDTPPNKNLTISNKLFHYMAGGLPVIASNTRGQAEIAIQCPGIIFVYSQHQAADLPELLNQIGSTYQAQNRKELKDKIFDTYSSLFAWQKESEKLIEIVRNELA